jgi:predicted transcriptional regulator
VVRVVKGRRGARRPLAAGSVPPAELELLALLDRLGESEVTALRTALEPQRPLAHASVVTLLGRLEARGLVRRRRAPQGRAYLYSLRAPGGLAAQLQRMAARVFGDDRVRLVSTLFAGQPPSDEELTQLTELIDGLSKRRRDPRGNRS